MASTAPSVPQTVPTIDRGLDAPRIAEPAHLETEVTRLIESAASHGRASFVLGGQNVEVRAERHGEQIDVRIVELTATSESSLRILKTIGVRAEAPQEPSPPQCDGRLGIREKARPSAVIAVYGKALEAFQAEEKAFANRVSAVVAAIRNVVPGR